MPIQSKGDYQLDFDNLDAFDPFQGSNKMILSPARSAVENPPVDNTEPQRTEPGNMLEEPTKTELELDETLPLTPSVENSLADVSTDISSTESSVVTVVKGPAIEDQDSRAATPDVEEKQDQDKSSASFAEDAPLPARGSYTLDFDNLDEINPFQTGGSKIQTSPVLGRKVPDNNPPVEETPIPEDKPTDVVDIPEVAEGGPVQPDVKPTAAVAPLSANAGNPSAAESTSQTADAPVKEGPVKLEFNFSDDGEVKHKPPPKKFGKRPPGLKSKGGKPASDIKPPKATPVKPDDDVVADVPVPKGAYSFDFDDPNFNPFGTKTAMNDSPKCSKQSGPVLMETPVQEQMEKPVEKEAVSPAWYVNLFI